jgi:hypothetical protein
LCWGQLERLKPRKKISKTDLSWMKDTLDFSFWQRKKLLRWYFLFLFIMLLNFPFICFLRFLSFRAISGFTDPGNLFPINLNYRGFTRGRNDRNSLQSMKSVWGGGEEYIYGNWPTSGNPSRHLTHNSNISRGWGSPLVLRSSCKCTALFLG